MARAFTVQQLIDRALKAADMYNSDFIDTTEALDIFNMCYTDFYDMLVTKFDNYFVSEHTVTLTANENDYALPSDFYKLVGADFLVSGNTYVTLKPFSETERNGASGTLAPVPSGTVRLRYVPAPTIYEDTSDEVDGISGWENVIVYEMAIYMLDKEETSSAPLRERLERLYRRIEAAAQNRDVGSPGTVRDIYSVNYMQPYSTLRYQLNQDEIRFISTEQISPVYPGWF